MILSMGHTYNKNIIQFKIQVYEKKYCFTHPVARSNYR